MLTIKLPYKLVNPDNKSIVDTMIMQYNHILKSAIQLLKKGYSNKIIYHKLNEHNNINLLGSRLILIAIMEATAMLKSSLATKKLQNKAIGITTKLSYADCNITIRKSNFIKRLKGKISKEEFKLNKFLPINFEGEKLQKGNRNIGFDITNNQVYIKQGVKKSERIYLQLPVLHGKHKQILTKLEYLANNYLTPTSVKLDTKFICFMYDELLFNEIKQNKQNSNRIMGIDLNPNFIGLSVVEYANGKQNIIHTKLIDLTNLNKNDNRNKVNYELIELSKHIEHLIKHYEVSNVFMEDLRTLKPKNHKKGKAYNKVCNNTWNRNIVINNLKKRCLLNNVGFNQVNPKYSSYIGNLQYQYHDAVNASIEISRRGYEIVIKKNKDGVYPKKVELSSLALHLWKETDANRELDTTSWESVFANVKNSKMRYRVQLDEAKPHKIVYRKKYGVTEYIFG